MKQQKASRRSYRPGQRVQVVECGAGIDSGRVGTIVPRTALRCRGDGIPDLPGHYSPLWKDEVVIRGDSGQLFTMLKQYLIMR